MFIYSTFVCDSQKLETQMFFNGRNGETKFGTSIPQSAIKRTNTNSHNKQNLQRIILNDKANSKRLYSIRLPQITFLKYQKILNGEYIIGDQGLMKGGEWEGKECGYNRKP